jgi:hypothetical protein
MTYYVVEHDPSAGMTVCMTPKRWYVFSVGVSSATYVLLGKCWDVMSLVS